MKNLNNINTNEPENQKTDGIGQVDTFVNLPISTVEDYTKDFEYKINMDVDCFWLNPPETTAEDINRKRIEIHIKIKINEFLREPANCAKLMSVILAS